MGMYYVVVPKEQIPLMEEAGGGKTPCVDFEKSRIYIGAGSAHLSASTIVALGQKGVAFNIAYFHDTNSFWPSWIRHCRYDHNGMDVPSSTQTTGFKANPDHREMIHKKFKGGYTTREIDRMAFAIMANDEWDDQAQNGKLHRMMVLLGVND